MKRVFLLMAFLLIPPLAGREVNFPHLAAFRFVRELIPCSLLRGVTALCLGLGSTEEQTDTPEVADDAYVWDFGKVNEGEVLKHNFTIKNDTGRTLNITNVRTSCGCTTSQVKKKTLLPQESTDLEVSVNSKGYSGEVTRSIYVETDNIDNPLIKYIIKVQVIRKR